MSSIPACKNCEHYYEDEFLMVGFCKFHYFENPDYINGKVNKVDMMAYKVREDEDLCGHGGKDFKEREEVEGEEEGKLGFWDIVRRIF